jgi:hypothetical protein
MASLLSYRRGRSKQAKIYKKQRPSLTIHCRSGWQSLYLWPLGPLGSLSLHGGLNTGCGKFLGHFLGLARFERGGRGGTNCHRSPACSPEDNIETSAIILHEKGYRNDLRLTQRNVHSCD